MTLVHRLADLHARFFKTVEAVANDGAIGFLARLVFLAVLAPYYFNSAFTKVGEGVAGFFAIQPGAYYQILPQVVEAAGGDIDAVGFFPWGLVVLLGTYAEFILPVLIIAGLFTRLAALGMIGFITVQSLVDIVYHKVDAATIGALFDRFPDSTILDQRSLWVFVLVVLVAKGAGRLSLDAILSRLSSSSKPA